jgi:hypothetical protein
MKRMTFILSALAVLLLAQVVRSQDPPAAASGGRKDLLAGQTRSLRSDPMTG